MGEKKYLRSCALFLLILAVLFLPACGGQAGPEPREEPRLKVTAGEQDLKVIYYGDRYNESREEINKRLKQAMEGSSWDELAYVALDEEIVIKAENFQTKEFSVTDYILKENGEIRYDEKVAQTSALPVDEATAVFSLPSNPAALLSSYSGDYEPGRSIRGFVVRAEIDGAPFAFAFILRTDAGVIQQEDPEQMIRGGRWELVNPAYDPVYVEIADTLPVPGTYEGKTLEELWDYAYDYYNGGRYPDGFHIDWAIGAELSPDGKRAAYQSNKNCIETNGLSVFLLDLQTGEEALLLGDSKAYERYYFMWWIDDNSLVCEKNSKDGSGKHVMSYLLCRLDEHGNRIIPLGLKGEAPQIHTWNGEYIMYSSNFSAENTRYIARIEDGGLTECGEIRIEEGDLMFEGAVSPDGSWAALKIATDIADSSERFFTLYHTDTKAIYKIDNPVIKGADQVAAIDMLWPGKYPEVNFYVNIDGKDHNELWRYVF